MQFSFIALLYLSIDAMRKPTKILLTILGIAVAVPLIGAVIIAAVFDPNDYKPMLVDLVKEKKQRTLSIPGNLELSFFPRLGVQLGQTSLSERNSSEVFASIEQAKLSVELLPLFSGRVVVDHILLDGLTARLQRAADGSTNIDDLLAKEDEPEEAKQDTQNEQMDFSVDGIRITNANLELDDQLEKRNLQASKLQLETGRLADGVPSQISFSTHLKGDNPQIAADVSLQSEIFFDRDKQEYAAKKLDISINGAYADWTDLAIKVAGNVDIAPSHFLLNNVEVNANGKQGARAIQAQLSSPELTLRDEQIRAGGLQAKAQLNEGTQNIVVNFTAPAFEGSSQAFTLPSMVLEATIKQAELDAKATLTGSLTGNLEQQLFASPQLQLTLEGKRGADAIQGTMTTQLSANMQTQIIDLMKIAADFTLPNPGGGQMKTTANGSASANLQRENVTLAFKGKLDQSQFDLKAGLTGFAESAYQFDAVIDKLDVDRYLASQAQTASAPAPKQGKEAPEEPIDLSALNDIKANGSIRIGALKAANISASNVRVDVRVANGKAEISPLEARLYGGSMSGSITASATNPARFSVVQRLNGINLGPLLKDAMDQDAPIEGKGNVLLNLTAQGATVSQLKQALNGTGQIELRDGSIRGVNIARTVRNAKATLQSLTGNATAQTGVSNTDERTDFSELKGSFTITNGVLRNDDLGAKSPLLRMNGNGTVNLVEEKLDYLVKASVVSTLKGQDGADLEALKGLTIPVRLTGPFTAIAWNIDAKSLVSEKAREQLEEKKDALRARAKEEVDAQKDQAREELKDQLKDRFKGLLGN